jgi:23S rRNA (uracil1939-C5)-methyltransferase
MEHNEIGLLKDSSDINGNRKRRRRGAKGRENSRQSNNATESREKNNELQAMSSETEGSGRKKRKKRESPPKPGEIGYLSKTQLRNARKRRAKQRGKGVDDGKNTTNFPNVEKQNISPKSVGLNEIDPSTKYLSDPLTCPLVKRAKKYFFGLDMPFKTYVGKIRGWRTVSKLPVRSHDTDKKCMIGLFVPKSHKVVSVPDSPAHHPSINDAINNIQKLCNELEIQPFNENDGRGYFRYVCINVDRSSRLVQLSIVWNSSTYDENTTEKSQGEKELETLITALKSRKDSLHIHSLWVHFNAKWKHADGIFDFGTPSTCGSLWKHVFGPRSIIEHLEIPGLSDGLKLHFQPNVFRQANLDAFTKIVIAIRKYIIQYNKAEEKDTLPSCLELYGGVGTLGLALHDITSNLLCSDENPFNKDCFTKSVQLLSSKVQKRISYLSKDATAVSEDKDNLPLENNAEIVIVDPPRKGLDEYVLKSLTHEKGKKSCIFNQTKLLIYVSCGFDAFETDCNELLKSKKWTLDHAEGHVLFPGSNAIETLAFFKAKL